MLQNRFQAPAELSKLAAVHEGLLALAAGDTRSSTDMLPMKLSGGQLAGPILPRGFKTRGSSLAALCWSGANMTPTMVQSTIVGVIRVGQVLGISHLEGYF